MTLSATRANQLLTPPTTSADFTAASVVYGGVRFVIEADLDIDGVFPTQVTITSHFIEVSPEQMRGLFPNMKAPGLKAMQP